MRYLEPHAHMVSRTTDDYIAMATAGCAAICEPAFWAGFDRERAMRLLNGLYLQSALMATRTHPAASSDVWT